MLANEQLREKTTSELSGEPVLDYHRRVIEQATNTQDLAGTRLCLLNLVVSGKLTRAQVAELHQLIAERAAQLQADANSNPTGNSIITSR